jgi:hypothetical protein
MVSGEPCVGHSRLFLISREIDVTINRKAGNRPRRFCYSPHAHEGSHAQAANFSFVCDVDGNGGDARLGARRGAREWAGKYAKHRIHPKLFWCLESSVLSLVRAARIGSRPGDEQVALALHCKSAVFIRRRFSGIASERERAGGERL